MVNRKWPAWTICLRSTLWSDLYSMNHERLDDALSLSKRRRRGMDFGGLQLLSRVERIVLAVKVL